LLDKHFVSKGGNIISPSWDHDKEHRDVVLRKNQTALQPSP
jgi:hypothetical protein